MSEEKIKQVTDQIDNRVRYCIKEYHLTIAEMLGILETVKLGIFMEEWEDE